MTALEPEDGGWHRGDWMQTFTGRQFYPTAPAAEDVDPVDIAHSLAMQCRYNGHVDRFYSVAEHCVLMARHALFVTGSAVLARECLLHDATEAYVGDMVRPLKLQIPLFKEIENGVAFAIARRFKMPSGDGEDPRVKEYDTRILLDERTALMGQARHSWVIDHLTPLGVTVTGWDPIVGEAEYLTMLSELGVS